MSDEETFTFVTLGGGVEPPPPPDPTTVVVDYAEWHAGDGDAPAVTGERWSFLALAEDVAHLVVTEPADRTRLVQIDGPRYAFHARPVVSGATMWLDSSGMTTYEACGFRFALDDPPGEGWLSGVADLRYDTYQVDDQGVFDAAWQTLEVAEVRRLTFAIIRIPGQPSVVARGRVVADEVVTATAPVRLDFFVENATFHVRVHLQH